MSQSFDPRNSWRFRRSLAGRPLPRRRPPPSVIRGAGPPPPSRWPKFITRALLGLAVLLVVLLLSGVGAAYTAYAQLADSLKGRLDSLNNHDSFQTTRIFDRHGVPLYEFFGAGKRTNVPLDQIAPNLIHATIAVEDKTFFKNTGVDYEGIIKAFLRAANAGEAQGGASTITQQLIKGVVLTEAERAPDKVVQRKLTEIVLAQELARQYSKNDVLNLYLNEIYYGNLAYGIEAASNVYFDTHAKDLTLAQASLLAGLPQLPSAYDPINYLEGGALNGLNLGDDWLSTDYQFPNGTPPPKMRQAAVLTNMVDEGYVTEAEARAAAAQDLHFSSQVVPLNAPHFVYYVRKLLEDNEAYGPQFANQGLSIYTTLDLDMQNMVQQKAKERIQELAERNIHNAAVVVMQPNTGEILAMVGSIDYNLTVPTKTKGEKGNVLDGQVNVTTRDRQPGSSLKPFTYLAAMDAGMTPASVLWDVPTEFPPFGPKSYKPVNYNGRWNGPIRIRTALANSLNMPAVKALKFAGVDNTIDLLHRAGIRGLQNGGGYYGLALTLGSGEVTPLDLTTAYNTLASGGTYYPPMAILKIVDGQGKVTEFKPEPHVNALNPDHVAIISNMLSDDKAREPIWGLNSKLKLSRPAAVKTGTSNDWRDAWTAGYTPYVTVGVWSGNNNNETTAKVESLMGGGIIWHNVMEELFKNPKFAQELAAPYGGKLPIDFSLPPDIVRKPMCALPGAFGNYTQELFSPDMLNGGANATALVGTLGGPTATAMPSTLAGANGGCSVYKNITVARLDSAPLPVADGDQQNQPSSSRYCKPVDGISIPDDMLTTIKVWNIPPADPDEKVDYRWSGGSVLSGAQIPDCAASVIEAIAPPGSVRMPDLRKFGENQAKEQLAALGITDVYVDYQSRERIPEIFDSVGPYVVLSTLPEAGEWIAPGTTVVLGIRAPDDSPPASVPTPAPEQGAPPAENPTPAPIEGAPPAEAPTPLPAEGQAPSEIPTPATP